MSIRNRSTLLLAAVAAGLSSIAASAEKGVTKAQVAAAGAVATVGPSLAMATPGDGSYDVSAALPYFVGLLAAITVIGGAKLGPAALAVGFKWIKATIFS